MAVLSEEMISKTPTYRILLNHASKLEHDLEQKKRDLEEVRRSNTEYAVSRSKWEEDLTVISFSSRAFITLTLMNPSLGYTEDGDL